MGSQIQKTSDFDIQQYAPPLQQYKLKHSGLNYFVWNHIFQSYSLIEIPFSLKNASIKQQYFQMYLFRHRHHFLVSTHFFSYHGRTNKASIFFQGVFTNLSRIKDLPFKDSLQFYYVALKGFDKLFRRFGYFEVDQAMFHITEAKKIKVWCDKDISKLKPEEIICRKEGREEDMVKKIIRIIEQNSDNSQANNFPIGSLLYQSSSNFCSAIQRLREVCQKEGFIIPDKLKCLDIISQGEFRAILDEYPSTESQKPKIQEGTLSQVQKEQKQLVSGLQKSNQRINTSPAHSKAKKQKGLVISQSLEKFERKSIQVENSNYLNNIRNNNLRSQDKERRIHQVVVKQVPWQKPMVTFMAQSPHQQHYKTFRGNIAPRLNYITEPTYPFVRKGPQAIQYHHKLIYPSLLNGNERRLPTRNLNQTYSGAKQCIEIKIRPPSNPNIAACYSPPCQIINVGKRQSLYTVGNMNSIETNKLKVGSNQRKNQQFRQENIHNLNHITVNRDIIKDKITNTSCSPLKQTLIHELKDLETKRQYEKFDEKSFKERFEQYKRNFAYQTPNPKQKSPLKDLSNNTYQTHQKIKANAFFSGILQKETVSSLIDSNGFLQQKRNDYDKINSPKEDHEPVTEQIPSVTDISDNISYFPSNEKPRDQVIERKNEKENINVFADRTNKRYQPDIDKEIWADMLKARNKQKSAPSYQ